MLHQNNPSKTPNNAVFHPTDAAARLAAAVVGEILAHGYCGELLDDYDKTSLRVVVELVAETIRWHLSQLDIVELRRMNDFAYKLHDGKFMMNLEQLIKQHVVQETE